MNIEIEKIATKFVNFYLKNGDNNIGLISFSIDNGNEIPNHYIAYIEIKENYRNSGYGSKLLEYGIKYLKKKK